MAADAADVRRRPRRTRFTGRRAPGGSGLDSTPEPTPQRTSGGYRLYSQSDIDRLRAILRMQRDEFLPLRVIRQELAAGRGRTDARVTAPEQGTDGPPRSDSPRSTSNVSVLSPPASATVTSSAPPPVFKIVNV